MIQMLYYLLVSSPNFSKLTHFERSAPMPTRQRCFPQMHTLIHLFVLFMLYLGYTYLLLNLKLSNTEVSFEITKDYMLKLS